MGPGCVSAGMKRRISAEKPQAGGHAEAESELARAVHRGSDSAFERLVERFEAPLFRYARSLLQNGPDAEEVVQDALLRTHRALIVQYDEARCAALALRPWLFKMVRNLASNKRRGKRHQMERPMEDAGDGATCSSPHQHSNLERKQQSDRLRRAIDALPVEARELIVLRFMEEMSYADIGRTVGATEASLRGKVFRSVALLRQTLEQEGVTHAL